MILVCEDSRTRAVAAGYSVDVDRWSRGFDDLMGRVGHRFRRVEPRRRVRSFVLGLIAGLPRTNCWTIAEHAGETSPDGMQHLLARASWDHDGVRDACAATWPTIWATRMRCSWSTRPAI
jgi:hypothetical protein